MRIWLTDKVREQISTEVRCWALRAQNLQVSPGF